MLGLCRAPSPSMAMAGLVPRTLDFESMARILRYCGRNQAIDCGESLHCQLIKLGFCNVTLIANNLMAMYSDFRLHDDAQKVFDEMPERNVVSWTALISAHTRAGDASRALKVFSLMLDFGLEEPNGYTFSAAVKACALTGDVGYGRRIHDYVLSAGLQFDTVLMNSVIDMYIKCKCVDEARRVFEQIFPGNFVSWNTMIAGYCREGNMTEAENLFHRAPKHDVASFNSVISGFAQTKSAKALEYVSLMHRLGVKLDHFTFPCAIKTCGSLGSEKMGTQIHGYIIKRGFQTDNYTGPALVDLYAKCNHMNEARKLFDEYLDKGTCQETLPLLNSILSGYASNGFEHAALDVVLKIYRSGMDMDRYTLSSALKVCTNLQNLRIGMQVHSLVVISGCHSGYIMGSVLVDFYAKHGRLHDALKIFIRLEIKDAIAWAGLITGCVQQGSHQLAFSLFKDMMSLSGGLDHFVLSNIIKTCSVLASSQGGKQVHSLCIRSGFDSESGVLSSLIDMYSKCGDIEDALKVFECATKKDAVIWTGLIMGCANNGKPMQAIKLFKELLELGGKPNGITLLAVLSAYRHAGMVEEACSFFIEMRELHGLVLSLEHYCCMVDILSRDGRFEQAKQMISSVLYDADETMLNAFLGACVIHQNVDLNKLDTIDLIQDSVCNTSQFVTLSNVYASLGKWDVSAKLREVMRTVGMKDAGRSWIEA